MATKLSRSRLRSFGRHLSLFLAYGAAGLVLGLTAIYIHKLQSQTDLSPWHTVELEEEFKAGRQSQIDDLADYLALEERLFAEVDERIYADSSARGDFSRFVRGSRSDPERFSRNWNRTFELPAETPRADKPRADKPRAGLLLLHGMSDSPYSLRAFGQAANQRGVHVLGLRLPGHGTAPVGMTQATWKDMAAAVRLGMRHLERTLEGGPIFIMGYSNGAALAVLYSLEAMADDDLPEAAGLVLVAPAIAVSSTAVLAGWQARMARWFDADKVAWTSVHPEVDPFKYTSFAVNAGAQVFALTRRIARLIEDRAGGRRIEGFPPVLAFLSVVDATVRPAAVVSELLDHLAPEGHELVLFDINYRAESQALLSPDAAGRARGIRKSTDLPFDLTIISNETSGTAEVEEWRRPAGAPRPGNRSLGLEWPEDVYALSHISTPFPPDDPVYGDRPTAGEDHVFLGRIEVMGERGVLLLSPTWLVRLRHNPFYEYVESRALEWMGIRPEIDPVDGAEVGSEHDS